MTLAKKILFVVEALTFAHVARSAILAKALKSSGYEIHFACHNNQYLSLMAKELEGIRLWPLKYHVSYSDFVRSMSHFRSPYDINMLGAYISEELELFNEIKPDMVVGDLRYSLALSCPKANIYYVNVVNAIWSPFVRQNLINPNNSLSQYFGAFWANSVFQFVGKRMSRSICQPFNQLRVKQGLPIFNDVFELHCAGDMNLHPDPPELFDVPFLPKNHEFIGPILYSVNPPTSPDLNLLEPSLPVIIVTLGSSGAVDCLPNIIGCLEKMPVSLLVATSGRKDVIANNSHTIISDFFCARRVIQKSSLVISNGGSPISYLALSQGVPVIGVVSNMDQRLTAQAIEKYGAGLVLSAESLNENKLKQAVNRILVEPAFGERAQVISKKIFGAKTFANFQAAIERAFLFLKEQDDKKLVNLDYCRQEKLGRRS